MLQLAPGGVDQLKTPHDRRNPKESGETAKALRASPRNWGMARGRLNEACLFRLGAADT